MNDDTQQTMTEEAWQAEAARRFGPHVRDWKFVCPACGHTASLAECRAAGMPDTTWAFSCIGRWLPKCRDAFRKGDGPCNYAGGGLFGLNPVRVLRASGKTQDMFAFAEPTVKAARRKRAAP